MVIQNMLARMKEKGHRKKIRLVTTLEKSNVLNRSNNRDCSLRTHLFLSYHIIYIYSINIPVLIFNLLPEAPAR